MTTAAPKALAIAAPDAGEEVKERVLALVVEKTGYPKDMLDLDLDLEADLGVDTVKQAEMFAAIREIYSIPRDENRKLRDYPTLAHVIRFVFEKRPDLSHATPVPETKPIESVTLLGDKEKVAAPPAAPTTVQRKRAMQILSKSESLPWSSRRPDIPRTCSTLIWI